MPEPNLVQRMRAHDGVILASFVRTRVSAANNPYHIQKDDTRSILAIYLDLTNRLEGKFAYVSKVSRICFV